MIEILTAVPTAKDMEQLRTTYECMFKRNLCREIRNETTGWFSEGLLTLARGPLLQDVFMVHRSFSGQSYTSLILMDVILGRSILEINALKACFSETFRTDMVKEITQDPIGKSLRRLIEPLIGPSRVEEEEAVIASTVLRNVERVQDAIYGRSPNPENLCRILAALSPSMIRAVEMRYEKNYKTPLQGQIRRKFFGIYKLAFGIMIARAVNPAAADAEGLAYSLGGFANKEVKLELLMTRLIRAAWDKEHFHKVKIAYKQRFLSELEQRIGTELGTAGSLASLLLAICKGPGTIMPSAWSS
jgi:annexin A7/11